MVLFLFSVVFFVGCGSQSTDEETDSIEVLPKHDPDSIKDELENQLSFGFKYSKGYQELEQEMDSIDFELGTDPGLGYDTWVESDEADTENGYSETINNISDITDSTATARLTIVNRGDTIQKTIFLKRESDHWVMDNMTLENGRTTIRDAYRKKIRREKEMNNEKNSLINSEEEESKDNINQ